jgi:hypothetical protein
LLLGVAHVRFGCEKRWSLLTLLWGSLRHQFVRVETLCQINGEVSQVLLILAAKDLVRVFEALSLNFVIKS